MAILVVSVVILVAVVAVVVLVVLVVLVAIGVTVFALTSDKIYVVARTLVTILLILHLLLNLVTHPPMFQTLRLNPSTVAHTVSNPTLSLHLHIT